MIVINSRFLLASAALIAAILMTSLAETNPSSLSLPWHDISASAICERVTDPTEHAKQTEAPVAAAQSESVTKSRTRRAIKDTEMTAFLDALNKKRRTVEASDMRLVTWNSDLESDAADAASVCAITNQTVHLRFTKANYFPFMSGTWDVTDYPTGFLSAISTYMNPKYDDRNLAADLQYVGCSVQICKTLLYEGKVYSNVFMSACLYASYVKKLNLLPPHNYQVGPACSACNSGSFWCSNGLCKDDCTSSTCTCNANCQFCGTLDLKSCKCQCKTGTSGSTCNVVSPGSTLPSCTGSSHGTSAGTSTATVVGTTPLHASCKEIKSKNSHAYSGRYNIAVKSGKTIEVYCEMGLNGGGYTFINPTALNSITDDDVQKLFTDKSSLLMRTQRCNGLQQSYSVLSQLPRNNVTPITIGLSSPSTTTGIGSTVPVNTPKPYLYFGFVPSGYQSNDASYTLNCETVFTGYIAQFPNWQENATSTYVTSFPTMATSSACDQLFSSVKLNPSGRDVPAEYFLFTETRWGTSICGCYTQTDRLPSSACVRGTAIGFR